MASQFRHGLSPKQAAFLESEGYLVLEDFASEEECHKLIRRMEELVNKFDPSTISIFSTNSEKMCNLDDYFWDSASDISFFFEAKAFDEQGQLRQPKALSINKVGHALHDLDPVFRDFSYSDAVKGLLASLGFKKPGLIQSMYIFKQPGIGGEVVPHQDGTFLYTNPSSCLGLWMALEDANIDNGCLWVLPQSHRGGLSRRFTRNGRDQKYDKEAPQYDMSKFIPLEMKAGSLVILHSDLVHQSFENKSSKSRHAYSLHAIETEHCTWAEDNWLQRRADFPLKPIKLEAATAA